MDSKVTMQNPYRIGSHLCHIFDVMKDGTPQYLKHIELRLGYRLPTKSWKAWGEVPIEVRKRRVASALRTIRRHLRLHIRYSTEFKDYKLVQLY